MALPTSAYCPVPLNPTMSGDVLALLVICTVPGSGPVICGENDTVNVQFAFVASELPQLFVNT